MAADVGDGHHQGLPPDVLGGATPEIDVDTLDHQVGGEHHPARAGQGDGGGVVADAQVAGAEGRPGGASKRARSASMRPNSS